MADLSPMMEQYRRIKSEHRDDILFFRLGDFYEMFADDAIEVSALLNLTLTSRNGQPMCGIPYHASRSYIARLLRAGKKIAVCEQISVPGPGKGLAERRVVEVITPGTTVDEEFLEKGDFNYLAVLTRYRQHLSFAYAEASTGGFYAASFPIAEGADRLSKEFERIKPRELIVQESLLEEEPTIARLIGERPSIVVNRWPDWSFDADRSIERLRRQFRVSNLKSFGIEDHSPEIIASGTLLSYLDDTAHSSLPHIRTLRLYRESDYVSMDESTQRNLELVRNLRDGDNRYSLFECMNETRTSMGARLLKRRILHPLVDPDKIRHRLDGVETLYRAQGKLSALREILGKSLDLERLCARIAMDRAHAKDLVAVRDSIGISIQAEELLESIDIGGIFDEEDEGAPNPEEIGTLIEIRDLLQRALADDPSIVLNEGNLIRSGYEAELDALKSFKEDGRGALESYLEEEREATGIPNLKIKYNRLIGYFFETSRANAAELPPRFIRRQSMSDAERLTTDRLIELESTLNGASDKVVELEKKLFLALREAVKARLPRLIAAARRTASIDVYQSLARAATVRAWNRPIIDNGSGLWISEGRHPVVEANLPRGTFVPNDLSLSFSESEDGSDISFALITGPNMAGKSTYLRQAALISLMAQIGSFVPAREARIGVVDRIFCRVGASDNLARGESTFLVEMNETAHILRNASRRSLVIMDEVGRGTGTNDGLAIAWAVCEELLEGIGCRTLFATHYHELSRIQHPRLANRSMDVAEEDGQIIFLKRLKEGATEQSYGIHVARLAGLPINVIDRASSILERLSSNESKLISTLENPPATTVSRKALSETVASDRLSAELESINPDRLNPLEALELVYRLKELTVRRRSSKTTSKPAEPELF